MPLIGVPSLDGRACISFPSLDGRGLRGGCLCRLTNRHLPADGKQAHRLTTSHLVKGNPTMAEPQGCLPAFLQKLLGVDDQNKKGELPYALRDDWLSAAELSFLGVLRVVTQDRFVACPKVGLQDIFFAKSGSNSQAYRNKINRKHVDFLLCDATSYKPVMGVELDDSSHGRKDRAERDRFVDQVFAVAGLPLLRVPAARSYSTDVIGKAISDRLSGFRPAAVATARPPEPRSSIATPTCPKCSTPMVLRTAKRGTTKGDQFYGCANYPKCHEVASA